MKAAVCHKPGSIELVERPAPDAPPNDWVAVDISNVGICGTDYHIFEGNQPYLQYPRVMGHELSGIVADDAGDWRRGDRVIINPYLACGVCRACVRGKPNCCYTIGVLGVHRDGGLCERINIPAANLLTAGDLNAEQAATVEFLAIGAHAVRRSQVTEHDRVLIVGAGPIGLGTALFARLRGADVHLLDANAKRLAMVQERFDFSHAHTVADGKSALMAATDDAGFDVVFDATGSGRAIENGFQYVAHGGVFVLVSVVKDTITFDDAEFHKREMSLIGSRNATREDFDTVIQALAGGAIDHEKLITHRTSLAELPSRFADWAADREDVIKAMVVVR
jgi:2-desacetyl-2-hydroxyethyl bacteriochlorophyllide A dehydrogenase